MTPYTQTNRRIAISTPLGDDVLLLRGFTGAEAISQLFHFDLDLLSENDSLKFPDIVGKNVTLRIMDVTGTERYWNGFISRFSQGPQDGQFTAYRAQMVPWLWFLTRTADCRIFQNMKAPDIIQKIFADLSFQDFELRLYGAFVKRDYCVQYRETDFNFVSRLMEEEGIYYFFEPEKDKHTLVLANDPAAHEPCPDQATARYQFHGGGITYDEDLVNEWRYQEEFRTGAWAQTDYNFETPSTSLAVTVNGKNPYEIYDFPGEHAIRSDGDNLARIRLQEQTVPTIVSQGSGTCRHFSSGFLFTLQDHYRTDLNQQYLLTAVRHVATHDDYQSGSGGGGESTYRNSFECIPFSTPYRPPRVTPEPFVQGCQTAVVVGPGGEEIYTDKYGRVKVQFHWDREGKKNENSSCWIRVSHPWAGQGWGSISIPRIGQEVIVDFLEGDPDQPIITGRVYNAEQMPPFGMPGGAVISGVKSNSTKGGGGNNEISLNDTKGTELINIHAQFDQQKKIEHDERVNVGHDRTESVGNNETITIGNNRTEQVGNDESILIKHDKHEVVNNDRTLAVDRDKYEVVNGRKTVHVVKGHTEVIDENMTVTVGSSLTETVAVNYAETVGAAMELSVGGALAITVGAAMAETVGGAKVETIGLGKSENIAGNRSLQVGKDLNETVAQSRVVKVTKDVTESVGGRYKESVEKEYVLSAKKVQIEASDEISIKTGSAEVTMKSNGDISIKGNKITVNGSGDIVMKGSTIKQN
jgi:type VI secretion system secreted protein VgrG